MQVHGLHHEAVTSPEDIFRVLERSTSRRKTEGTLMNARSSRSHAIFTITIVREGKLGTLNFVDLSGSENVKRSGSSSGARAREASNINQGLLAIGRVMKALVQKHKHVPYRDSVLTRMLSDSSFRPHRMPNG